MAVDPRKQHDDDDDDDDDDFETARATQTASHTKPQGGCDSKQTQSRTTPHTNGGGRPNEDHICIYIYMYIYIYIYV